MNSPRLDALPTRAPRHSHWEETPGGRRHRAHGSPAIGVCGSHLAAATPEPPDAGPEPHTGAHAPHGGTGSEDCAGRVASPLAGRPLCEELGSNVWDGGSFRIQVSSGRCLVLRSGGRRLRPPAQQRGGGCSLGGAGRPPTPTTLAGDRHARGAPGGRLLGTRASDSNAKEAGGQLSTMPVKSSLDD